MTLTGDQCVTSSFNYKETLTQHLIPTYSSTHERMQTCTCSYLRLHRCLSRLCHSSLAQFSLLFQRVGSERRQCNHSRLPPSAKGQIKKLLHGGHASAILSWILFGPKYNFGSFLCQISNCSNLSEAGIAWTKYSSCFGCSFLCAFSCLQCWWDMKTCSHRKVTLASHSGLNYN